MIYTYCGIIHWNKSSELDIINSVNGIIEKADKTCKGKALIDEKKFPSRQGF